MIAHEGRNIVTRRLTLSVLPPILRGNFLMRRAMLDTKAADVIYQILTLCLIKHNVLSATISDSFKTVPSGSVKLCCNPLRLPVHYTSLIKIAPQSASTALV